MMLICNSHGKHIMRGHGKTWRSDKSERHAGSEQTKEPQGHPCRRASYTAFLKIRGAVCTDSARAKNWDPGKSDTRSIPEHTLALGYVRGLRMSQSPAHCLTPLKLISQKVHEIEPAASPCKLAEEAGQGEQPFTSRWGLASRGDCSFPTV